MLGFSECPKAEASLAAQKFTMSDRRCTPFSCDFLCKSRSFVNCLTSPLLASFKASASDSKSELTQALYPGPELPAGHSLFNAAHSTPASPAGTFCSKSQACSLSLCIRHLLRFSRPYGHVTGGADTKINKDRGQEGTPIAQELLGLNQYSK